MKNPAKSTIPIHQTTNQTETNGIFVTDCSMPCITTKYSRDTAEATLFVSASKNVGVDIVLLISVYILNADGIVNGITNLKSTISHKTRNVFLGRLFIAIARIITTAIIKTAPEKLTSSKVILITSFQISNNFFQLFNFFNRKFLPTQKCGK